MALTKASKLLRQHEKDCADCKHTYLDHLWENNNNSVYVYKCQAVFTTAGTGSGGSDILCPCQQYKPMTLLEAYARVEELLNDLQS